MSESLPTAPDVEQAVLIFPFLQKVRLEEQQYFLQHHVRQQAIEETVLLFRQDDPVTHLYVLVEGIIEESRTVQEGRRSSQSLRRRLTATITKEDGPPRTLIGVYDLFHHRYYSTSAYAHASSRLYKIDAAGIDWLMTRVPNISTDLAPLALVDRLRTIPFLGGLGDVVLGFLADASVWLPYQPGVTLYQVGDFANYLYFIDQGQVYLDWFDERNRWLGNGAVFGLLEHGEASLDAPTVAHQAQIVKRTSLIVLLRRSFINITGLSPDVRGEEVYRAVTQTVNTLPIFAQFGEALRHKLVGYVSHYHIPTPHILLQQGEMNDSLWLLLDQQRAQVHALAQTGEALQSIGVEGPAYFGEAALYAEAPIEASIEAEEGSQWVRLHRHDLEQFSLDERRKLKTLLPQSTVPSEPQPQGQSTVYDWLQSGETIRLLCRRHWINLWVKLWPSFGVLVGLLGLSLLVAFGTLSPSNWIYGVILVGGAFMMGQVVWNLIDYLNDYLIVTNRRVVLQEEVLFFRKWRQEALLERIQNVDINIGFWGRLFRYGNIVIRTAGTNGSIPFTFVTNPRDIERRITALRNLRRVSEDAKKRGPIQDFLEGRLRLRLHLPAYVCLPEVVVSRQSSRWQRLRRWVKRLLLWRTVGASIGDHIIWRKHWLILLGHLMPSLTVLAIIVFFAIAQFLPWLEILRPTFLAFNLLLLPIFVVDCLWITWIVLDWRNDTYEVTATTIIDVEKKPLFFDENRRTARLDEIQNIEVNVPSLLHYIFNFGNVKLQTASTNGDFTFNRVSAPHDVAAEIQRRIEAYQTGERIEAAKRRAQELPDWFDIYDLLGGIRKRRARPPIQ